MRDANEMHEGIHSPDLIVIRIRVERVADADLAGNRQLALRSGTRQGADVVPAAMQAMDQGQTHVPGSARDKDVRHKVVYETRRPPGCGSADDRFFRLQWKYHQGRRHKTMVCPTRAIFLSGHL